MEKRSLGATGLAVSPLGFGGAEIGFLDTERRAVADILNGLLDSGVNLIDTAATYDGSEVVIGESVGHRRDDFVLVSKCGRALEDVPGEAWSAACVAATVDRALKRLRTDRLDVMLLHSCDKSTLEAGEALGALAAAREAGKVRFIGYSGDNEAVAFAAGLDDVDVIETSINICDQANIDGVLPLARERDLGVLAKRPIANAAWKAPSQHRGMYVDYSQPYRERLAAMGTGPAQLGFEGPEADAWPEIAMRFTLAQPGVSSAIVGTSNPANVERNLKAAAKGPLPRETVAIIQSAFRDAEAASGEPWPGLQ